jgi:hypothetical protein
VKKISPSDIALAVGFLALCYGLWLAWRPACFIAAGVLLILFGILTERGQAVKGAKRES